MDKPSFQSLVNNIIGHDGDTYLETSEPSLRWIHAYYHQNPQLDYDKAVASLVKAEAVLKRSSLQWKGF